MPLSDAWVDFLAGWCSGAVAVLAVQPVDTVLTRWQAGLLTPVSPAAAAAATTAAATASGATNSSASSSSYTLVRNMTRSLTQNFGYTALWRGSSPMIGAVPIQNALLMGGYGLGLQYANKSNSNSNNKYMAIFVGGCSGGVLQSFLMSPVELVKVSQQCIMMMPRSPQTSPLRNVNSSVPVVAWNLLTTTAHGGIPSPSRAAWTTGLGATLLRDGIPHGVWFVSYEWCKVEMQKTAAWQQDSVMVPLLSGAVAATTAWAVGYPADLIKTRIQSRATVTNTSNSSSRNANLGILATARELIHESNGRIVSGLYRGFLLKLVRSVPASMIGFTTYEFVKKQVLLEPPTVLG